MVKLILCIYSLLLVAGGLMGYFKGGSLPSLFLGGGSGLILLIISLLWNDQKKLYYYSAFILLLLLDGFFSYRFIQSFRFFPAGCFSLLTTCVIIILIQRSKLNRKPSP